MQELTIVLPYKDAGRLYRVWAGSEQEVNFRGDDYAARRCTASFAASELQYFLSRTGKGIRAAIADSVPSKGLFIELEVTSEDTGGGFRTAPRERGLLISGHGRGGLLSGTYEFLREQGWRWLEPGARGECPGTAHELKWPTREAEKIPSFRYRGLDAFKPSHDSSEYLLWMARNCLNVCFRKPVTAKLSDKLGMYSRMGGHLLQKMLNQKKVTSSGNTIWDEHPEWYGMPPEGKRSKETALDFQLCVSAPGLADYIGAELVKLLSGPLKEVDILDLWGFDSWGSPCACPGCLSKGNGADQHLFLLSSVRTRLDRALANGNLERKVLLATIAYQGTASLEAPTKPVPNNLIANGDICIFYPILRCYRHELKDSECGENSVYKKTAKNWAGSGSGLRLWAGEYYNVSKFEDMPLLFFKKIPLDMRFYNSLGFQGATYMHPPLVNWGMRSLTQLQHARYSWDVNTHDEEFLEDYFTRRYGRRARGMRRVYELIEEGSRDASAWRSWGESLLSVLLKWDGAIPAEDISFGHFKSGKDAAAPLRRSLELQLEAASQLDKLIKAERKANCLDVPAPGRPPINPEEAEEFKSYDVLEHRIGESRRLLIYGIDTINLMLLMLEYRTALYLENCTEASLLWEKIEEVSDRMSLYYIPVKFENPGPGLVSPDALTRTQLRPVIARCRKARGEGSSLI